MATLPGLLKNIRKTHQASEYISQLAARSSDPPASHLHYEYICTRSRMNDTNGKSRHQEFLLCCQPPSKSWKYSSSTRWFPPFLWSIITHFPTFSFLFRTEAGIARMQMSGIFVTEALTIFHFWGKYELHVHLNGNRSEMKSFEIYLSRPTVNFGFNWKKNRQKSTARQKILKKILINYLISDL